MIFPANDKHLPCLQAMESRGFVACNGAQGWWLTSGGKARVYTLSAYQDRTPLCEIRPLLALSHLTSFELQLMLQDGKWIWRCLPDKKALRDKLPPYVLGGDRVWYSSGIEPSKLYMQANY